MPRHFYRRKIDAKDINRTAHAQMAKQAISANVGYYRFSQAKNQAIDYPIALDC